MEDSGKGSLCCGGGGGRIWMDTPQEERFSDLRLKQARAVDADVLATACPYCITNFEESRLNLEYEDVLEVRDIAEIINDMLQSDGE
jgi:Fe-S oxidoreductase